MFTWASPWLGLFTRTQRFCLVISSNSGNVLFWYLASLTLSETAEGYVFVILEWGVKSNKIIFFECVQDGVAGDTGFIGPRNPGVAPTKAVVVLSSAISLQQTWNRPPWRSLTQHVSGSRQLIYELNQLQNPDHIFEDKVFCSKALLHTYSYFSVWCIQ